MGLLLIIGPAALGTWDTSAIATAILGGMLLITGMGILLWAPHQTITVDHKDQTITLETKHRFGSIAKRIRFDEIANVSVAQFGDKEGGSVSYHVEVKLKTGKVVPLFANFFEGGYKEYAAVARCRVLQEFLEKAKKTPV